MHRVNQRLRLDQALKELMWLKRRHPGGGGLACRGRCTPGAAPGCSASATCMQQSPCLRRTSGPCHLRRLHYSPRRGCRAVRPAPLTLLPSKQPPPRLCLQSMRFAQQTTLLAPSWRRWRPRTACACSAWCGGVAWAQGTRVLLLPVLSLNLPIHCLCAVCRPCLPCF